MLQLTWTQIVHRIKTTCLILCWSASCCLEELLWVMSTRALGVFCGRLFYTLTVSHLELQLHHSDNIFTGLPSNFMVVAENIPYFNHLPNKTPKKQTLCKDILNPFWPVGGFLKICLGAPKVVKYQLTSKLLKLVLLVDSTSNDTMIAWLVECNSMIE